MVKQFSYIFTFVWLGFQTDVDKLSIEVREQYSNASQPWTTMLRVMDLDILDMMLCDAGQIVGSQLRGFYGCVSVALRIRVSMCFYARSRDFARTVGPPSLLVQCTLLAQSSLGFHQRFHSELGPRFNRPLRVDRAGWSNV